MRKRTFVGGMALSCLLIQATALAQIPQGSIVVDLELVAEGLTSPVALTHAGDGSGRLFVVDQIGQVRVIDADGNLLSTPFLDIGDQIVSLNAFFDERGALGLAFHPDYENNGRFFVRYSMPREGDSDEPCNAPGGFIEGCHAEVLAEFRVSSDPNVAEPGGTILFSVDEPQFNHNSGAVHFGPDGFLYFSLGDGGGANDGLADTPPSHGPIGNGQNVFTPLGTILRIDVDNGLPYGIPEDNPFVGQPGLDEIYAYGFRNPYRFSFDRNNGDLIVGDVGQNLFEEVDIVEKGANYGWVTREGFHCFDPLDASNPPADCADTGSDGEPLIDPIAEYDHGDGIAVVGGFVYRGSRFPMLKGRYVFGDFSRTFFPADGRLFYLDPGSDFAQILEFRVGTAGEPLGLYLLGIGEDEAGELYVLTSQNLGPTGDGGQVYRIVRPEGAVTICHIPPGNPDQAHELTVNVNALPAHFAHGDEIGDCEGVGGQGEAETTRLGSGGSMQNLMQGQGNEDTSPQSAEARTLRRPHGPRQGLSTKRGDRDN